MPKQSLFEQTVKADTDAALSVVEMEQNQELLNLTEQQRREHLIARCHEVIGRIQGVRMISKFADVSSLLWLRDVKSQKVYKEIPNIGTWESFCKYIGLSRQKVDEDLINLKTFGEEFLTTVSSLRVGYHELRKLRHLSKEGSLAIDAEYVTIGEEKIPLTPDNAEDLQAAIETLLETRDKTIDDQTATIRAKDRLLETKEKLINRQEKALAVLEQRAATKGLSAEDEAFIQQCENARITIDGFLSQFDPEINPLPEDHTPRMRAALMETIGYFRRVIDAAFDTASERYGNPDMDDDWVPPHERKDSEDTPDCYNCEHHKALLNPKKGIKIPGVTGKCIRLGGLCIEAATGAEG